MMLFYFLIQIHLHADELWLKVGDVRQLSAPPTAQVRVGIRGPVRVVDAQNGVRVIALKPGQTSVIINERVYAVHVALAEQREFVTEMRARVHDMMGLTISLEGAKPVVRGTLLRFSDWLELADISRHWQGEWEFRAHALADVAAEALEHLRQLSTTRGFPPFNLRVDPEVVAEIPATAQKAKDAITQSLGAFGIRVEISTSDIPLEPLVRTHVVLAEVERSFGQQLGVSWPTASEAQLLPKIAGEQQLLATLKALEQSGHAQVLASPNLVCRSGGEAHFHAGGEFPIKVVDRHLSEVVWKSHGVILNVKPKADFRGAISLNIETEISMLDMAHAVNGVPALKVNNVRSHFDLPGKRTIALSGLLRADTGESTEGLPFLSRIPILGALFSSRNFQRHRSELVVFVTPEVDLSPGDDAIKMPEGWVTGER